MLTLHLYEPTEVSWSFPCPQGQPTACTRDCCCSSAVWMTGSQWPWTGAAGSTSVDVVSGVFSAYFYQRVMSTYVPKVKAGYPVALIMFLSVPTTLLKSCFKKRLRCYSTGHFNCEGGQGNSEEFIQHLILCRKSKNKSGFFLGEWERQKEPDWHT